MKGLGIKYSKQAKELYSWNKMEKPALIEIFESSKSSNTVLDLGCGDGRVFQMYNDLGIKENNIYGVDIDSDLINIAKQNYPKANLKVVDINRGFNIERKVDLIVSVHVLHYFNRKALKKIFNNAYKLLNNNGRLVFLVAHPIRCVSEDLSKYFLREEKEIKTPWKTRMNIMCNTLEDYIEPMVEAGFVITHIKEPVPIDNTKEGEKYRVVPSRLLVEGIKLPTYKQR